MKAQNEKLAGINILTPHLTPNNINFYIQFQLMLSQLKVYVRFQMTHFKLHVIGLVLWLTNPRCHWSARRFPSLNCAYFYFRKEKGMRRVEYASWEPERNNRNDTPRDETNEIRPWFLQEQELCPEPHPGPKTSTAATKNTPSSIKTKATTWPTRGAVEGPTQDTPSSSKFQEKLCKLYKRKWWSVVWWVSILECSGGLDSG